MERTDREAAFVQIGEVVIALDKIARIDFEDTSKHGPRVWIHLVGDPYEEASYTLGGKAAVAFKNWWDDHANVWVIEKEEGSDE